MYLKNLSIISGIMLRKLRLRQKWVFIKASTTDHLPLNHRPTHSSRPDMYCKKGVLKHFAKWTGKHLQQSLFFNKVCRLEVYNFFKKDTLAQMFSCEFCKIFKNTFFIWKKRLQYRCFIVNLANILAKTFFIEQLRVTASLISKII